MLYVLILIFVLMLLLTFYPYIFLIILKAKKIRTTIYNDFFRNWTNQKKKFHLKKLHVYIYEDVNENVYVFKALGSTFICINSSILEELCSINSDVFINKIFIEVDRFRIFPQFIIFTTFLFFSYPYKRYREKANYKNSHNLKIIDLLYFFILIPWMYIIMIFFNFFLKRSIHDIEAKLNELEKKDKAMISFFKRCKKSSNVNWIAQLIFSPFSVFYLSNDKHIVGNILFPNLDD